MLVKIIQRVAFNFVTESQKALYICLFLLSIYIHNANDEFCYFKKAILFLKFVMSLLHSASVRKWVSNLVNVIFILILCNIHSPLFEAW